MFDFLPPSLVTGIVLLAVAVAAVFLLSWALETAEADMVADLGADTSGYSFSDAGEHMRSVIAHSADREARILGHNLDYLLLDEDGDVDTRPPLTRQQERMLHKIDLVELQEVTFQRWADLEARFRQPPSCPSFPVSLVGHGVSIPRPHNPEVLA